MKRHRYQLARQIRTGQSLYGLYVICVESDEISGDVVAETVDRDGVRHVYAFAPDELVPA